MELNTLSSGYIQSQRTEYSENTGALLVSLDLLNPFGWTKRTSPNKEHAFATAFQQTNLEISDAVAPRFKTRRIQDLLDPRNTKLFTWDRWSIIRYSSISRSLILKLFKSLPQAKLIALVH